MSVAAASVAPSRSATAAAADGVCSGWVTVASHYGEHSVDWYVDGERVFRDGTGVGGDWSAYLILNLSLCAGEHHPAPSAPGPVTFAVGHLRVYR